MMFLNDVTKERYRKKGDEKFAKFCVTQLKKMFWKQNEIVHLLSAECSPAPRKLHNFSASGASRFVSFHSPSVPSGLAVVGVYCFQFTPGLTFKSVPDKNLPSHSQWQRPTMACWSLLLLNLFTFCPVVRLMVRRSEKNRKKGLRWNGLRNGSSTEVIIEIMLGTKAQKKN